MPTCTFVKNQHFNLHVYKCYSQLEVTAIFKHKHILVHVQTTISKAKQNKLSQICKLPPEKRVRMPRKGRTPPVHPATPKKSKMEGTNMKLKDISYIQGNFG